MVAVAMAPETSAAVEVTVVVLAVMGEREEALVAAETAAEALEEGAAAAAAMEAASVVLEAAVRAMVIQEDRVAVMGVGATEQAPLVVP